MHWVEHGKITDEVFATKFNIHGDSVDHKAMKSQRVVHLTHPAVVADTIARLVLLYYCAAQIIINIYTYDIVLLLILIYIYTGCKTKETKKFKLLSVPKLEKQEDLKTGLIWKVTSHKEFAINIKLKRYVTKSASPAPDQ